MSLINVAVPSFDRRSEQILFLFYISFVRDTSRDCGSLSPN